MSLPISPAPQASGVAKREFSLPALRAALGRFATGVTIVACRDTQGRPAGLTVNSFSAVSLEPPLVLWCLRAISPALDAFLAATHFSVNVLAENQVDLARRFAQSRPNKFGAGQWSDGLHGAPLLAACPAVFECEQVSRQVVGDHVLFIGQVLRLTETAQTPLVFQAGHYHLLGGVL